ncbi:MAG: hypothetical protein F7B11_03995 [Caldisphaeraceae archaeon]|nr:hypothetical protein [Caldisphaeraceae archaeon]
MVNVLVVSDVFWPEGSGGELATYLYLKRINKIDFTLLTGTPYSMIPKEIIMKSNVKIITVPWLRKKEGLIYGQP